MLCGWCGGDVEKMRLDRSISGKRSEKERSKETRQKKDACVFAVLVWVLWLAGPGSSWQAQLRENTASLAKIGLKASRKFVAVLTAAHALKRYSHVHSGTSRLDLWTSLIQDKVGPVLFRKCLPKAAVLAL